mgnify:CR=1 FL=1
MMMLIAALAASAQVGTANVGRDAIRISGVEQQRSIPCEGRAVSGKRVDLGGRRIITKKNRDYAFLPSPTQAQGRLHQPPRPGSPFPHIFQVLLTRARRP